MGMDGEWLHAMQVGACDKRWWWWLTGFVCSWLGLKRASQEQEK